MSALTTIVAQAIADARTKAGKPAPKLPSLLTTVNIVLALIFFVLFMLWLGV